MAMVAIETTSVREEMQAEVNRLNRAIDKLSALINSADRGLLEEVVGQLPLRKAHRLEGIPLEAIRIYLEQGEGAALAKLNDDLAKAQKDLVKYDRRCRDLGLRELTCYQCGQSLCRRDSSGNFRYEGRVCSGDGCVCIICFLCQK